LLFTINPKEKILVVDNKKELIKPFYNIIKEIKNLRRKPDKGTINNLLYFTKRWVILYMVTW
jgi:hypothetical protein